MHKRGYLPVFFCISSQICVPDHGGIALSGVHPFKFMLLVSLQYVFLVDL